MSFRLYSAVVDSIGPFPWQARQLVWSLVQLAGVSPAQIILHVVNADSDPDIQASLKRLGVEVVPVDAYPNHPYCNKLQQLPSLASREFDEVVLLDCDVMVLEEPPSAKGGVIAKPVDFANPPMDILERLYAMAGLPITSATSDVDNALTVRANANGGVYVLARENFELLSLAWRRWADWCLERREIFGDKWIHIDQVSFAMAVTSEGIPFAEMDRRFNVPTHVPQPGELDCNPAILHYHRAVDTQQLLLPIEGLPRVNGAINRVNTEILAERRRNFDNKAFWSARYAVHPDLGSGVGSRGQTLARKQQLLSSVVSIIDAQSILDVGSGDGYTASVLPERVKVHAVDVAATSRELYLQSVPGGQWNCHDFSASAFDVDVDMVVCLDVLIHLSSGQAYQAFVKNLLSYGVPVLLSGFDAQPVDLGPMTYFQEPLSTTISAYGYIAIPVEAYRGLTAFIALPQQAEASSISTRDIQASTLIDAVPLVSEPLLLVEAIFRSRKMLGFFPDHLPRCIEYAWIVQQFSDDRPLSIVDAGAGVSVLPFMLSARGHHVITIDPHTMKRNEMAQDLWNEWGYLDYSLLDRRIQSQNISYQDTSDSLKLDAVVSVSVIEHLPYRIRKLWLEKACRQLVRGGRLLLTVDTVPFSRELWNYSEGQLVDPPEDHGSIDTLIQELSEVGFKVEHVEHATWLPKSRVGMARICASKVLA